MTGSSSARLRVADFERSFLCVFPIEQDANYVFPINIVHCHQRADLSLTVSPGSKIVLSVICVP
jgi:hypothetical protein